MLGTLTTAHFYAFYGMVAVFALLELAVPARTLRSVDRRWLTNIGLFLAALGIQRLLAPASVLIASEMANRTGAGLFQAVAMPTWLAVFAGVLVLDLWKYVEHRLFHVPLLWRLHVVHHADTDTDFTTTERHHPFEVVFGIGALFAITYGFGLPLLSVAIYLLLAPPVALFSHANIRVPVGVDLVLRSLIVTPSIHAVHHSAARHETDSNFGTLLTIWDRIFRTYRVSTPEQTAARVFGLEYFRDARSARLDRVLCMPFLAFATQQEGIAGREETAVRAAP